MEMTQHHHQHHHHQNQRGNKQKDVSGILKYLPRATSAVVNFQNPVFSPGRDKRSHHTSAISISGPLFAMIPDDIMRRKPRKDGRRDDEDGDDDDDYEEPTSPKVSCIGQIKMHKDIKKHNNLLRKKIHNTTTGSTAIRCREEDEKKISKKHGSSSSKFLRFLGGGGGSGSTGRKLDNHTGKSASMHAYGHGGSHHSHFSKPTVPSLGHMKTFASGRQSLTDFDWRAEIAPVNDNDPHRHRNCQSDDERIDGEGDEDENEVIIPFSAPILVRREGNLMMREPRKEVSLWKRRNFDSPPPINLKSIRV